MRSHLIVKEQLSWTLNDKLISMQTIERYFKELTEIQRQQLVQLDALYREWNAKINVISRKDIDNLYIHHVLHSLAIVQAYHFQPKTNILDFGTGGGFPGIPLAIMLPHCNFKLIDGTGKKIHVAQGIIKSIGLTNCRAEHLRGEDERGQYDFVVSRAVMPLPDMLKIVRKNVSRNQHNAMANGIICLKGGSLDNEMSQFRNIAEIQDISLWFEEDWFKEKQVVYVPV